MWKFGEAALEETERYAAVVAAGHLAGPPDGGALGRRGRADRGARARRGRARRARPRRSPARGSAPNADGDGPGLPRSLARHRRVQPRLSRLHDRGRRRAAHPGPSRFPVALRGAARPRARRLPRRLLRPGHPAPQLRRGPGREDHAARGPLPAPDAAARRRCASTIERTVDDRRIESTARLFAGDVLCADGDDAGRRGRPGRPPDRLAPADRDEPAHGRRRGRPAAHDPARCCASAPSELGESAVRGLRRGDAHLPRGRASLRARSPGRCSPRGSARAPTSACSSRTEPSSWSRGSRPPAIGAVAVPFSTFSKPAELAGLLPERRRRAAARGAVASLARLRARRCREAIPGLDLAAAGPLASPSVPMLRRIHIDAPSAARPPRTGAWTRLLAHGGPRRATTCSPPSSATSRRRIAMVIVHTSGSTSEPKGVVHTHGPLIRHLDNLNEIRALHAATRSSSRTRRGSGSAASRTRCSARSSPARASCARTRPTPRASSTSSSASGRRW